MACGACLRARSLIPSQSSFPGTKQWILLCRFVLGLQQTVHPGGVVCHAPHGWGAVPKARGLLPRQCWGLRQVEQEEQTSIRETADGLR